MTADYKKQQKQNEQRRKKVVALNKRGFSDREVGELMTPVISKQRVAQILKAEGKR